MSLNKDKLMSPEKWCMRLIYSAIFLILTVLFIVRSNKSFGEMIPGFIIGFLIIGIGLEVFSEYIQKEKDDKKEFDMQKESMKNLLK